MANNTNTWVDEWRSRPGFNLFGWFQDLLQPSAVDQLRSQPTTPGPEEPPQITTAEHYGEKWGAPENLTLDALANWFMERGVNLQGKQQAKAAAGLRGEADTLRSWDPSVAGGQYFGRIPVNVGAFRSDPFMQATMESVRGSMEDPEVIDPETAARIKAQATATILGTAKTGRERLSEELARRGVGDSGVGMALQRQHQQRAAGMISGVERDIEIERATARRESELAAQQVAAALTGQLGRIGLGEQQLLAQTRLGELGAGRGMAGLELGRELGALGPLSQAYGMEADMPVFVPDVIGERDWSEAMRMYEEAQTAQTEAERTRAQSALTEFVLGIIFEGITSARG